MGFGMGPLLSTRPVELMGTSDQIAKAEQLIQDVLAEAESVGSGIVSHRVTPGQPGYDRFLMQIPSNKIGLLIEKFGETIKSIHVRTRACIQPESGGFGLVSCRVTPGQPGFDRFLVQIPGNKIVLLIGKFGETIKSIQVWTRARIQIIPGPYPGDTSEERTLRIEGTSEQIEAAKELVCEVCWIGPEGVRDGTTERVIGSHASSLEPSHTWEGTYVRCLLPLISEVPHNWREVDYKVTHFPDGSASVRLGA